MLGEESFDALLMWSLPGLVLALTAFFSRYLATQGWVGTDLLEGWKIPICRTSLPRSDRDQPKEPGISGRARPGKFARWASERYIER